MDHPLPHTRYLVLLGAIFALVFTWSAIRPNHVGDWLLENALVLVGLGLFLWLRRIVPFTRTALTAIFLFLCLHELGAHYTYAEVPYQQWFPALAGGRNDFDRLVHFAYGLLLAGPIREIVLHAARLRGIWSYLLPLDLTMSTSMLYEIIEWGAAEAFGGGLGVAFLGTQGDPWDAQKDMALASLGALLAMLVAAALDRRRAGGLFRRG